MRNQYLENLDKIEFVVTYACTGRCKHCSEGSHAAHGEHIDSCLAADAVRKIAAEYSVKTVMTFGGEPLLYPDAVYDVMSTATELGIEVRQVITNGYFSASDEKIREVASRLYECGVNDLLVSVDAFHQETIPLDTVRRFLSKATAFGIPTRLQPAWLVSTDDVNPYNLKTREILESLADLKIPVGTGNVIFAEGNAKKYLAEYFVGEAVQNPYVDDPRDVRCASFSPNGDVLGSNVYRQDITEILEKYTPEE